VPALFNHDSILDGHDAICTAHCAESMSND